MLVRDVYERIGIGAAPKNMANKPLLSVMLEKLGRLPSEDESFFYEGMKITPKSITDGKPLEVVLQILDDEETDDATSENEKEASV